ncbi:hypothetical protein CQW23_25817 [Capsicum baccatum]|uniref:Ubiquitin-like protease family profile domain-containing protein n=1 Tax=Capsicum baccatum TaxID=33114 RepID=A0A2G2VM33_CAPBA|nr:hypothetical protein CQW23_25817 [Capsicum baccatum]
MLKRTEDELQQLVGTITKEFGDFSTIPPREILIKAGFASPVSLDQSLKKRKTVMFEKDNQAVMDDDTSGHDHAVHYVYGLYNETHKDAVDKGEIGVSENSTSLSWRNWCVYSESPAQHENYDKGSLNDMEVSRDEESNKQHILEEQQLLVRELQASKAKASAKRETKKSRVLRSPYISKYGSGSKDMVDFDKEEKLKKETDNHYRVNASGLGYRQLDFIVAHPQFKNSFYLISEHKTCWNDVHLDGIFYHLRKKSKIQLGDNYRYTMTSCFFKTYVEKTHTRYYPTEPTVELSTQQDYAESIVVAKNEDAIANIIHGFCMLAGLPWYMVDEVYVLINCGKNFYWVLAGIVLKERLIRVYDSLSSKKKKKPPIEMQKLAVLLPTYLLDNGFYDKTERTDWPSLEAYKGKITQQIGLINEILFDVDYMQNIPQQASDSSDCGVFVCAYAEILSEGLQVHSYVFDAASQHARYAYLLWHYGVEKTNERYTSDNGDRPRPRKSVIEEIDANVIVTLE